MSRLLDLKSPRPREISGRGSAFRPLIERQGQFGPTSLLTDNGSSHWGLICEFVDQGHAISIGRTKDGGAISVTLYLGEERFRSYAHSADELEELFEGLRRIVKAG